jgi:hypothetical protein
MISSGRNLEIEKEFGEYTTFGERVKQEKTDIILGWT